MAKYRLNADTGCYEWTASKFWDGYGQFRWDAARPNLKAHRAAWELAYGPIPDGHQVCHKCDNPGCVNVEHMFLGTHQDNVTDKVAKGRHRDRNGQLTANLTDEQIDQIYALGPTVPQGELARRFGVTQSRISMILNGKGVRKTPGWTGQFCGRIRGRQSVALTNQANVLRNQGYTYESIAHQLGVTKNLIWRSLNPETSDSQVERQ